MLMERVCCFVLLFCFIVWIPTTQCILLTSVYCPNHNPMTGFSNADHASGMRSREDVDIKTALCTFQFRDPSNFWNSSIHHYQFTFFLFCSCSTFRHSQRTNQRSNQKVTKPTENLPLLRSQSTSNNFQILFVSLFSSSINEINLNCDCHLYILFI